MTNTIRSQLTRQKTGATRSTSYVNCLCYKEIDKDTSRVKIKWQIGPCVGPGGKIKSP
jgi:hypothetical protein